MTLSPTPEELHPADPMAPAIATWMANPAFLRGQLELARGFLGVAEATDDDAVARRNLALAERALRFVQSRMNDRNPEEAILRACEELSERTRALNS